MPVILPSNDETRPRRTASATAALFTSIALLIGITAGALFGWPQPIHVGSHYLFTPGCKPPTLNPGGKSAIWTTKAGTAWVYHGGAVVCQLGSVKLIREGYSLRVRTSPSGDRHSFVWIAPPFQSPGRKLTSVTFTSSPPPSPGR